MQVTIAAVNILCISHVITISQPFTFLYIPWLLDSFHPSLVVYPEPLGQVNIDVPRTAENSQLLILNILNIYKSVLTGTLDNKTSLSKAEKSMNLWI